MEKLSEQKGNAACIIHSLRYLFVPLLLLYRHQTTPNPPATKRWLELGDSHHLLFLPSPSPDTDYCPLPLRSQHGPSFLLGRSKRNLFSLLDFLSSFLSPKGGSGVCLRRVWALIFLINTRESNNVIQRASRAPKLRQKRG